jgi:hypothetical protein
VDEDARLTRCLYRPRLEFVTRERLKSLKASQSRWISFRQRQDDAVNMKYIFCGEQLAADESNEAKCQNRRMAVLEGNCHSNSLSETQRSSSDRRGSEASGE